jgi:uncharacterized membrane protein YtjA (UPF0391 family)
VNGIAQSQGGGIARPPTKILGNSQQEAAFLGFSGIAGSAAGIAQILFFVFLIIAVISSLTGRRGIM